MKRSSAAMLCSLIFLIEFIVDLSTGLIATSPTYDIPLLIAVLFGFAYSFYLRRKHQ